MAKPTDRQQLTEELHYNTHKISQAVLEDQMLVHTLEWGVESESFVLKTTSPDESKVDCLSLSRLVLAPKASKHWKVPRPGQASIGELLGRESLTLELPIRFEPLESSSKNIALFFMTRWVSIGTKIVDQVWWILR